MNEADDNSVGALHESDADGRITRRVFMQQAAAPAEHLNLKDRGILGNGHFAMLESNNKQVFEVIREWIEQRVPAAMGDA